MKLIRLILLSAIIQVQACTPIHKVETVNPQLPESLLVKPIPLKVGVYLSSELIKYEKSFSPKQADIVFSYQLGSSSADLFTKALTKMFVSTILVPNNTTNPLISLLPLAGIFSLEIENFDHSNPFAETNLLVAEIFYKVTLHDKNGELIDSWSIKGSEYRTAKLFNKIDKNSEIEWAMLDAMAQFMLELRERPKIKVWMHSHGINE